MSSFKFERLIHAPLEKVWATADFKKSAGPYPMKVQNNGDPNKNGVGFTRIVTSGKFSVTEQLLEVVPMQYYIYTLLDGVPVKKDYRGKVSFTSQGSDTLLSWSAEFSPKILGLGWVPL